MKFKRDNYELMAGKVYLIKTFKADLEGEIELWKARDIEVV